jgi:uncharacterized membrane protein HdeD (DUF308 family)
LIFPPKLKIYGEIKMSLELIFGLASLIFGIYNMFLFISTGVYTNIFLGIIFFINGLHFMKAGKNSVDNKIQDQKHFENSK